MGSREVSACLLSLRWEWAHPEKEHGFQGLLNMEVMSLEPRAMPWRSGFSGRWRRDEPSTTSSGIPSLVLCPIVLHEWSRILSLQHPLQQSSPPSLPLLYNFLKLPFVVLLLKLINKCFLCLHGPVPKALWRGSFRLQGWAIQPYSTDLDCSPLRRLDRPIIVILHIDKQPRFQRGKRWRYHVDPQSYLQKSDWCLQLLPASSDSQGTSKAT